MKTPTIKTSVNYGEFDYIKSNRPKKNGRVDAIVRSIQQRDLTAFFPILVRKQGGKLLIYDGQHRFAACEQIGLPVHYLECDAIELGDIATINTTSHNWTLADFSRHFQQLGNRHYAVIGEFCDEHDLKVSLALPLLRADAGRGRNSHLDAFRAGTYTVNTLAHAAKVMGLLDQIAAIRPQFHRDGLFIEVLSEAVYHGLWDQERFHRAMTEGGKGEHLNTRRRRKSDYHADLMRVYNDGAAKSRHVFFGSNAKMRRA